MLSFIASNIRRRVSRAIALVLGIAIATSSFVLLTSAAQTSRVEVTGTVDENARSAYDILVRPKGSTTALEADRGLVQDNYLSGIFGGITLDAYNEIKQIPGVSVAAPVANLGYVHVVGTAHVDLRKYISGTGAELFRAKPTYVAANGLANYKDADLYSYYSTNKFDRGRQSATTIELDGDQKRWPCWYFNVDPYGIGDPPSRPFRQKAEALPQADSPFDPIIRTSLECYSAKTPTQSEDRLTRSPPGFVGVSVPVAFPMLIAAIDPEQEDALVGLKDAVSSGQFLQSGVKPKVELDQDRTYRRVPLLLSSDAFSNVDLKVDIERLDAGAPAQVRRQLDSGGARTWLSDLQGKDLGTADIDLPAIFERLVSDLGLVFGGSAAGLGVQLTIEDYWTPGAVKYEPLKGGNLKVDARPAQSDEIWASPMGEFDRTVPMDNLATQVRPVTRLGATSCQVTCERVLPKVVGRFDPNKIAGFSDLSRVPLESYRLPEAVGADAAARAALKDEPLRPDRNLGGYLRQPPALLTNLDSIAAFTSSRAEPGTAADAPISSVRIRVDGVNGVDDRSLNRVSEVVSSIRDRLGDSVETEVTVGSSPAPQRVLLPAGVAGDKSLLVEEFWTQKGVGVRIVEAINAKSAALFGLILIVCGLYVAQGSFTSVRSRQKELATLLALGWGRGHSFIAVMTEVLVVGVVGGIFGTGMAWGLATAFDMSVSSSRVALALPVGLAVAVLAGLLPAWRAARTAPIEALRSPVAVTHRTRQVRTRWRLAVANVVRSRGPSVLGIGAMGLAVAALTVLLTVMMTFRGAVTGSLLGTVVNADVQPVDFLAVGICLFLGSATLVDLLVMNQRERTAENATLVATGWSAKELALVMIYEGLITAVLGALLGVLIGAGVSIALVGSLLSQDMTLTLVLAASAAGAGGVVLVLLSLVIPVLHISRRTPTSILAQE